jgi:hypothetical protein
MVDWILTILITIIVLLIGYIFIVKKRKYLSGDNNFKLYNKLFELYDKNVNYNCNNINNLNKIDDLGLIEKQIYNKISLLRNYEHNIVSKRKKIKRKEYLLNSGIIKAIYENIYRYHNLLDIIPILDELIERQTFYYRYRNLNQVNKINIINSNNLFSIPVIEVAKHHHAVEWIYKYEENIDSIGTIIHIDSHADMNPIKNDLKFVKACINNKKFSKKNLLRIYNSIQNIGSVLVPFVAPYSKNNGIIWITPDWVQEPFCQSQNIISASYDYCCFHGNAPKYMPNQLHNFKKIHNTSDTPVEITTCNLDYFERIIDNISNYYILNIDLDYFVTFGNQNYTDTGDAISNDRTIFDFGYMQKSDDYIREQTEQDLLYEMNLIRKRIDKFLVFIETLKKKGKFPKIIIICDSTRIHFSHEYLGQEFIQYSESQLLNEFTPKYLTYWLHQTVLNHLKYLFTNI